MITQSEPEAQAVEAAPGAQLVTNLIAIEDATHRCFVTLTNRAHDDELLLDVLTIGDAFAHIANVVRQWLKAEKLRGWSIDETLPVWEADF